MTDTPQSGLAGRLLFWVLGTALFLSIAILPYYMYFQFAAESTTRLTVAAVTGSRPGKKALTSYLPGGSGLVLG